MLLELKGGETVKSKAGRQYIVRLVLHGRRHRIVGIDKLLFNLDCIVRGNHEFTQEELQAAGVEIVNE